MLISLKMHRVDILLPTYNGEIYIQEQIKSLLQQSHKDIRIIIRDDCSSDNTNNISKNFAEKDDRVVIISDINKNVGLVSNIEFLLSHSDANYIIFCDQDDVWFENKIEILLKEMLIHENELGSKTPILVHSDCYVTDQFLNIKGLFKASTPLNYGLANSLFKFHVQGASTLINISLKKKLYPFISNIYLHDRYIHLVVEVVGHRFYVNSPLMYYRQHNSNQVGSSSFTKKIIQGLKANNFVFFQKKDRLLIETLYFEKFQTNKLLEVYLKMTSQNTSLFQKIKLKKKYRIRMRFKELFIMILKSDIFI
jgi:rhamnosyltransferase